MSRSAVGDQQWRPHLLFLINGINGSSDHFDYITDRLLSVWGDDIVVHACSANDDPLLDFINGEKSFATCDGVDKGGKRIAEEVKDCVHAWDGGPPLSISFWGHSMGGLYARYAIAELMADSTSGMICDLPPRLFLTTACPHIGVAGTFSSLSVVAGSAVGVLGQSGWLGKSGQQLFFEDDELLLWQMACEDRFVQALERFEFRLLVANVCNDYVVDFCVSALQPRCPQWLSEERALSNEFPHVVYDSKSWSRRLDTLELDDHQRVSTKKGRPPVLRERSKFQRGGTLAMLDDDTRTNESSSWFSWLWASGDTSQTDELVAEPSPTIYCSGHQEEIRIEEARLRLAAMPWRLVCMRFDDYPGQIAHDDIICKLPWINVGDGVEYIVQIVLEPVFSSLLDFRTPAKNGSADPDLRKKKLMKAPLPNVDASLRGVDADVRDSMSAECASRCDDLETNARVFECVHDAALSVE